MVFLKKRYCFISVFVLLLFSSCVFSDGTFTNGGGSQTAGGNGGSQFPLIEVSIDSDYVKPITQNTLDVSGDFYKDKQLYLIKVNTDSSTTAGGYVAQGTTGSLTNANMEIFNNEENMTTKVMNKTKAGDESMIAPVHIPFKPANIPLIPKSALNEFNGKKYNQKGSAYNYAPKTGNSFIIGQIENKRVQVQIAKDDAHYYSGKYCDVWYYPDAHPSVTSNYSHINATALKNVAERFDSIYEKETALLGSIYWLEREVLSDGYDSQSFRYVNPIKDTKIDIVFYDMNNYKGAAGGVGGFIDTDDLCAQEYVDMYNEYAKSNGKEAIGPFNGRLIIHVDSGFLEASLAKGEQPYFVYSTLAHEFQHLLNYINRQLRCGTKSGEVMVTLESVEDRVPFDVWFTEMLSAIVEGFFTQEIGYNEVFSNRTPRFLNNTSNGFTSWGENAPTNEGGKGGPFKDAANRSYGPIYGFGLYLTRNFGGVDFVNRIATSSLPSKEAIVEAVKKYAKEGKEDITFETLLCQWPQVLVNKDGKNNKLPTFNKSNKANFTANGKTYTYNVDAINIDNYGDISKCFKSTTDTSALNSSGFTISKISKDHPAILKFNLPTNNKVKMFVVVGDDE